jgi:cystathionine gamma-synthase
VTRFFIHKSIEAFAADIVIKHGRDGQLAMLFPSHGAAQRCVKFMHSRDSSISVNQIRIFGLVLDRSNSISDQLATISPSISAVIYQKELFPIAKQYWQHSGDGISSRRAEFCYGLFQEGILTDERTLQPIINGTNVPIEYQKSKGPRRYQKGSTDNTPRKGSIGKLERPSQQEARESSQFLEERFGRNLDVSLVDNAKSAVRRRIAGSLMGEVELTKTLRPETPSNARGVAGLSEEDVYLYPCGMNSIFNAHKIMLETRGSLKSISFGFPYVDTLKILQKFGPGCIFYGNGSSQDLDDLEQRLKSGEKYLALFCEFPGNPMLKCPDLQRIRYLADTYDFGVVVDETIGNFVNVHVLPYADLVVTSLTKIFSGECNVMGGATIINPKGRYYRDLKRVMESEYEDNCWAEDVIFMERNSRHFVSRIEKINDNAELICEVLHGHPLVKNLYYPKYNSSRDCYDACRTPSGGYGGLLSFEFYAKSQAIAFYDRLETAKGPSLGTNFTLVSPYVLLAHFTELDWAAKFGVPSDLIRVSVGLEDGNDLKIIFGEALKAAEEATP